MTGFKELIFRNLSPLIGKKCVLPDLPYYPNVGDLLIWEGMEQFLKDNGTECLWRSSISTFKYRPLSEDVCICLVGGGNFGDLWRGLHEFKNKIVQLYPNNRIIIFPQSVYYNSAELCESDSKVFARHKELYLCARDMVSYNFLKTHFSSCHILLVPDMALYLDFEIPTVCGKGSLLLMRTDKEAANYTNVDTSGMDIMDWPTISLFERVLPSLKDRLRRKWLKFGSLVGMRLPFFKAVEFCLPLSGKHMSEKWNMVRSEFEYLLYLNELIYPGKLRDVVDWFAWKFYQPLAIRYCVVFMKFYDSVFSTRLHGGILGYLLNKKVYWMDDANGKISSFYDTWTSLFNNRISLLDQG